MARKLDGTLALVKPHVVAPRKPDAVARLVALVVVLAMDMPAGRRITHFRKKSREIWVEDFDAPSAIMFEGGVFGIGASLMDVAPNLISLAPCTPMRDGRLPAAARFGGSGPEMMRQRDRSSPAVALAEPPRMTVAPAVTLLSL
jgi:hypothetical protein